jgi:hypothetical protein
MQTLVVFIPLKTVPMRVHHQPHTHMHVHAHTHIHTHSIHTHTLLARYSANLAAMRALNSELLSKLSSSQAGGDPTGDSGHLIQELRDILASSKVCRCGDVWGCEKGWGCGWG